MRQRAAGAIAMASEPRLLIADEPTTSLDVTIQAQYLNLLKETQRRSKLAILFVSHDMGIIGRMCDRVAVMYAGRIVEEAPVDQLFDNPAHPYSEALLNSLPNTKATSEPLPQIKGDPPDMHNLPAGCAFALRCPKVMDICHQQYPPMVSVDIPEHRTACWLHADHPVMAAAEREAEDGAEGGSQEAPERA
jgi:oligopeptide/dipeptide ABC transporter ATP-binding protein